MKKSYSAPVVEIQRFELADFITASGVTKGTVLTDLGADVSNFDAEAESIIAATESVFD